MCVWWLPEGEEVDGAIWCVMGSDGNGTVLVGKERFAVVFEEDVCGWIILRLNEDFTGIGILIEVGGVWSGLVIKDVEELVVI